MSEINFFGELFEDLCTRIETEIPAIKWIDQNFGQLDNYTYDLETDFPAVLIDFSTTIYSDLMQYTQMADITVEVRLIYSPFASASSNPPMDLNEEAVQCYLLEQRLYETLQGWHNDFSLPFTRIGAESEKEKYEGLRIRILNFSTGYEDSSASTVTPKATPNLSIEQEEE
jgi:hypothetical protein